MYVVEVVPIARGAFKETLSFFSKQLISLGVVVEAPVRGKAVPALVIAIKDARAEKLALRDNTYALKKLESTVTRRIFPDNTIEAFREIAHYHALSIGALLAYFTPSAVSMSLEKVLEVPSEKSITDLTSDALVLQAESEERVRMYRNVAREAFARGESVFLLAPTIAETENLYEKLHRGIEDQVVLFNSSLTKKTILTRWNHSITNTDPLLIIGTASFLAIPRPHIGTYIVERETARSYTSHERNSVDARVAAYEFAKKQGARIIYADFPLRIETREKLADAEVEELMRLQISAQSSTIVEVLDTREKKDEITNRKKKFSVLADSVLERIHTELKDGGRVFLYAQRKGLAPLTVCNDCGTPVTDPSTGTPMTLHKTEAGNVFLSYRSGAVMPANISCRNCGSWNLHSLGIGVDRVVEEVEKQFKDTPLFILTADAASTHTKAKKVSEQFFNTPRSILVGTDRALPYLKEPIDLSVVVSIDSLLSISAWRAHEYALNTLFYLEDHTDNTLIVQTRQPENEVMRAIACGNPTEYIRHELSERKQFGYPPFTTFIGLTWSGTEKAVTKTSEIVRQTLHDWDIVGPLPPRLVAKNRFLARAVLRLEKGSWPNEKLISLLKLLPYEVTVTVDPDEIV